MEEIPQLSDDGWTETLERLTHYALGKFRKMGWCRDRYGKMEWAAPGGDGPDDVAMNAIAAVLEGDRRYNQQRYPDFREFLRSVVDSKISHLAEQVGARKTGRIPVFRDKLTGAIEEVELPDPNPDPEPAELCASREAIDRIKSVVATEAAKEPRFVQLLECLEAGITKRSEVADYMGIPEKQLDNIQKRLGRKLSQSLPVEKERQQ